MNDLRMTVIDGLDTYYYPLTHKQKSCKHLWVNGVFHNGNSYCIYCNLEKELFEHLMGKKR